MNSLFSSILTTAAVAAVAVGVIGLPDFGPGVDHDSITGSIKSDRAGYYSLNRSGEFQCSVRRGAQIKASVYRLETSGSCKSVLEDFDTVLYWTDTSSGGVVISGSNGPILEFAEADGVALESINPASPLFSLTYQSD